MTGTTSTPPRPSLAHPVPLSAFAGSPALRDAALARLSAHIAADHLQAGSLLWDAHTGKGSIAGCLVDTSDPTEWQYQLGLASWLAYALDTVTSRLRAPEALAQTQALLQAIPPGADTQAQGSTLIIHLLGEVAAIQAPEGALAQAMTDLQSLHRRAAANEAIDATAWRPLRRAAVQATDALGPAPAEGERQPLDIARRRGVGLAIEAAAWDPRRSPTVVSELLRQWLALEGLASDEAFGWTDADDALIRKTLAEMHAKHLAGKPEETRTVFDFLEIEHDAMATRLRAYLKHGGEHGVVCAERACALLRRLLSSTAG